jgi:putative effector of murein hydrolase
MGAFYLKYKRIFFWMILVNAVIVVMQLGVAWGHWTKYEWGGVALSIFFSCINGWCAVSQYNNWQRVKREEKEYMWTTLSSKVVL